MKIYLLRHGQAEGLITDDVSRSLTNQGIADVKKLGCQLAQENTRFDLVFVSPYRRTQQTYLYLSEPLSTAEKKQDCEALLSNANPEKSLFFFQNYLQKRPVESVLLVTHQPFISSMIALLVDGTVANAYQYPMMPASLVVLEMDVFAPGVARVVSTWHEPYE